jgi:hypothetical protein
MRLQTSLPLVLLAIGMNGCIVVAPSASPSPQAEVVATEASTDVPPGDDVVVEFHDALAPFGEWTFVEGYGQVWTPRVEADWRPYTTGHWVYTDLGWAWVAEESWGWAPFHYGRWFYRSEVGWAWVPGRVWAPAWVSWRNGGGYVGWAALSPSVGFEASVGLRFGGNDPGMYTDPVQFAFIAEGAMLAPRVTTVLLPATQNVTIIHNTVNVTNYTVVENRVVNRGVSVEQIERVSGHPVPRLQATVAASVGGHGPGGEGRIAFYQPAKLATASSRAEFGGAGVPSGGARSARRSLATNPAAQSVPNHSAPAHGQPAQPATPSVARSSEGEPKPSATPQRTMTASQHVSGASPSTNVQELENRHRAESARLTERQAAERKTMLERQAKEKQNTTDAEALAKKHATETKALEARHQHEQQELAAKHAEEQKAAAERAQQQTKPPA